MRALAFSIDDAYVMPFKVLWQTLITTNSVPENTPIFIMHDNTLSANSIADLNCYIRIHERTITFINLAGYVNENFQIKDGDHVSHATFYRLFVSSILPDHISSLVYLDIDTIAVRSIRNLFDTDLTHPIAAVDHLRHDFSIRVWGPQGGTYFQAGVLIIDLDEWRLQRYEEVFLSIAQEQKNIIKWWDQDILNIAFKDNWHRIPIWYNVSRSVCSIISAKDISDNMRIIHFDGANKPWNSYNVHPLHDAWAKEYFSTFGKELDAHKFRRSLPSRIFKNIWRKIATFSP